MAILKTSPTTADSHDARQFRHHMGRISRHSAVFFAGTLFTAAAGYLFKVYLARVLGAEALGIYALGMTIVGFLGIFNALGLPQSAVRFVSAYCATGKPDQLRGFLGRSIAMLAVSNILLGAVVLWVGPWIASHLYHTPALSPYLKLFVLIMISGVLNTFLGQVLAGYKDIARRTIIATFIGTSLTIAFTLVLLAAGLGLKGYIVAQVGSAALVLALLIASVWKLTPPAARSLSLPLPPLDWEVLSFSAVVFGMDFLLFLMGQADKVLIGAFLDAREVGIYSVAAALVAFVPIVLQSVNQIFSPTIADLYSRGEHDLLGRMFQTLTKWIIALTVPLAAVMVVFAVPLMHIFGHDFEVGWPILIIGTAGQLINCGVGSVGYLLLMSGRQRSLMRIQAVMAAVMVILNFVLIPKWGITGAAVAGALTNIFTNVWSLKKVHSELGLFPYNRSYARLLLPMCASLTLVALVRVEFSLETHALAVIAASLVLAYLTFVGGSLLSGLDEDDRFIVRAAWQRLRDMSSTSAQKPAAP